VPGYLPRSLRDSYRVSGVVDAKQVRGFRARRTFIEFCNFGKIPAWREKFATAERIRQHAERVRYPDLFHLVGRNLELMLVRIAKVNRMRDAMVLKMKSNSALFQFLLRSFKILSVRAQGKMEDTHRVGPA
jgi:hypothetical protein